MTCAVTGAGYRAGMGNVVCFESFQSRRKECQPPDDFPPAPAPLSLVRRLDARQIEHRRRMLAHLRSSDSRKDLPPRACGQQRPDAGADSRKRIEIGWRHLVAARAIPAAAECHDQASGDPADGKAQQNVA